MWWPDVSEVKCRLYENKGDTQKMENWVFSLYGGERWVVSQLSSATFCPLHPSENEMGTKREGRKEMGKTFSK